MKFEIKGLQAKVDELKNKPKELTLELGKELKAWANDVANIAIIKAPADEGYLRNSIKPSYSQVGDNFVEARVTVGADYAAYLEFGTRRFAAQYVATLPPDWKMFAASFKGKGGGSFEEFVMRLTKWVLRKGIGATYSVKTHRRIRIGKQSAQTTAEADAYAIALYIVRNGIQPHPFLYPAVQARTPQLLDNISKL